jgi:peptide deformylase
MHDPIIFVSNELQLHYYGSPVLRKKGLRINHFDDSLSSLAQAMVANLKPWEGCGLAAPQVGLSLRLFVVDFWYSEAFLKTMIVYDGKRIPLKLIAPLVVINPEITVLPQPNIIYEESCLSIPTIALNIKRIEAVQMRFQDLQGTVHSIEAEGIFARVLQHENDHLNGVLITDHITHLERKKIETKLKQIKRGSLRKTET